jgi:glutaredoxin 3
MKTVIWSKENCPHCQQAKELLRLHDVPFEERKIDEGWTREDLLEAVPNARSVPQIFMYGTYVGGYTDLEKYFEENISGSTEGKL